MRLLHRHLPDLQAARRRARQPARAHLPHQGHAGERPAGRCPHRAPHRPLPFLPLLHDHLPLGRELHAPGGPCARPYRADLRPPAGGTLAAPAAGVRAAAPGAVPRGAAGRDGGEAPRALPAGQARRDGRHGAPAPVPALAGGPAADLPGRGGAAHACGAADGLRPDGARPRHQRGDGAPADALRRGGGRGGGGRAVAGRSSTIWAGPRRGSGRRRPMSAPGSAPGRTASSSMRPAAARRSRTMATCCATTRRSRRTRPGSRRARAT